MSSFRRSARRPGPIAALAVTLAVAAPALLPAQFMTGLRVDKERQGQSATLNAKQLIDQVGFDQKMGNQLPLDARFRDETGRELALGDLFGDKPVVLTMVYYRCTVLCSLIERAVARGLKPLDLLPGKDFDVVFVSFDPEDTATEGAVKRAETLDAYGKPEGEKGWHFLTGGPESIAALTDAIGFRYVKDPGSGQYAHPAGTVILTPDGRVGRYLFGGEFAPRDLKLALVESGQGTIGSVADQLLLVCFHYDTNLGKYTAATMLALRVGATLTLLALGAFLVIAVRRERRNREVAVGGPA